MLAMVVAKAKNNVIGKDNQLIWHLPKDLQYFKKLTTGHVIIMGRKTLESLPFLLPNREHWVVTRQADYKPPYEGVRVFHSPEEAVKVAEALEVAYCIGGAQMYESFMPYAETLYVTEIDKEFEGDAHFPTIDLNQFEVVESIAGEVDEKNPWPFSFVTYRRKE
ncbi:dihydrofolate reductase [Veillonella sp. R32]|uniref:dihydrofolate reductase n=1 Tax=Veillonella sp. R32 TaxID=2021312 RepID=UPI001389935F|nr:dihydrofolate reductase [Veillonella sp. R32]KAF1683720.1 dihydrofolate reductase [Veillonella sp. R32]